ncbi:MAG: hypothetical protein CMJ95_11270 [Planctomycetes bacterium]|nr:hypothetical protein [Planctomycetota bacterium]MAW77948.1 hypothetical protein [Planctomycetota bacterium]
MAPYFQALNCWFNSHPQSEVLFCEFGGDSISFRNQLRRSRAVRNTIANCVDDFQKNGPNGKSGWNSADSGFLPYGWETLSGEVRETVTEEYGQRHLRTDF